LKDDAVNCLHGHCKCRFYKALVLCTEYDGLYGLRY
jgi:hypothetical protein